MINTRKELKRILKLEKKLYFSSTINRFPIIDKYCLESDKLLWRFQRLLRKEEFFYLKKRNTFCLIRYLMIHRRKNKLGARLGLSIPHSVFQEGLRIYHYGSIVVNGNARVGKNCKLHGNNCIGNKGVSLEAPIIGDNVDIGFGSCIIGNITLGNNLLIGANSLVNKSIDNDSDSCVILVGSPVHKVVHHGKED